MQTDSRSPRYTRAIRIWHWCTFLLVLLQVITVLTHELFLDDHEGGTMIKERMAKEGVNLNDQQTFAVFDSLSEPLWALHTYIGYVLVSFFVLRFVIEAFQPKTEKFGTQLKASYQWLKLHRKDREATLHFLKYINYTAFYLLVLAIAGTGLWMALFSAGASQETFHEVRELHEKCYFGILIFSLLHLIGVIRTEWREKSNIVSGMIHGGNEARET